MLIVLIISGDKRIGLKPNEGWKRGRGEGSNGKKQMETKSKKNVMFEWHKRNNR